MPPIIVEDRTGQTGVQLRGGGLALWKSKAHEVMLSGPAETGKTFAALFKLDGLLWNYPRCQAAMVRKTYASLVGTAIQTYSRKILAEDTPVQTYGGDKPQWFDYPNGSRLWVGGLDNPEKILSSERDFIYVNQSEELSLDDWAVLTTRATGRAGNAPYAQVFGDCNPGPPHHWIKGRPSLQMIESRHEDNPTLYDGGDWTEQGRRTLAILDALPGVRRDRLRYGRWVSAEGTVYQFDPKVHVVQPFSIPRHWPRFRSVDFGYGNAFCCQWWALDDDGRLYLYREIYHTERIVSDHARQIRQLTGDERVVATIADHDREDRETLNRCGVHTILADKAITPGIQAVEERLAVQRDGKPRLFLFRGALAERDEKLAEKKLPVCTEQEFDVYTWPKGADGKPAKEVPVDLHNHGMDALRYAVRWADARQRTRGLIAEAKGQAAPEKAKHLALQLPDGVFG
jgi:PBSX family phage terminase large subunit